MRAQLRQATRESGENPDGLTDRPWTIHDLRRTARTLLQRVGVPYDVGEAVLGHRLPGVGAVYARHTFATEKRQAMEKLADLIISIARTSSIVRK